MIVLAVLLLLAVALVVLFVVVTGITPTVQLEWSQISTSVSLTALGVFLLGAVCLLVAQLGLVMLLRGNRKNWERRRELKRLRRVEAERARHADPVGGPARGATAPAAGSPARPATDTATATGPASRTAGAPGAGATAEGRHSSLDGSSRG